MAKKAKAVEKEAVEKEVVEKEAVDQENMTEQASEEPRLGVQDIKDLLTIVDVACQRGAFRAEEMASVGGVFSKVKSFVSAIEPKQEEQEAETEAK